MPNTKIHKAKTDRNIDTRTDISTIIVEDFNISLSETDPAGRKINKEIIELKNTISQLNLINIYRILHLKQNTHSSQVHMLRGKFIALNACIKKGDNSKINNANFQLWKLKKEGQIYSKVSRRKEINK